ncbi:hypothetical protein CYY_003204, partial [Polysphondylium violaceum]
MNSATKKNKKKNQETNEVERLTKLFEQQLKEVRDQHNAEIRKKVEDIKMKDEKIKMNEEEIKMKDEEIKMNEEEIKMKDEKIKMKDEKIKMKDEEIKMKDEEIKMKDEEIKMNEEDRKIKDEIVNKIELLNETKKIKNLFVKFPTISKTNITLKSSSTHQDCECLEDKKFQLLPNFEELALKNGEKESNLIAILRSKFYRPIAENEQALYKFVEAVFVDALQILDYESEISIEIEKSLDGI